MKTRAFLQFATVLLLAAAAWPARAADEPRGTPAQDATPSSGITTAGLVDINTADAARLETVPGIGTDFANAVIAARPFKSVDDLQRVPGLGAETVARLRGRVTASPPPPPVTKPASPPMVGPSKPATSTEGKATDRKAVTERYDKAAAEKPAAKK